MVQVQLALLQWFFLVSVLDKLAVSPNLRVCPGTNAKVIVCTVLLLP